MRHQKGEQMQHVDFLSRAPIVDQDSSKTEIFDMFTILSREDEIFLYQRTDEKLKTLIDILEKPFANRSKDERGATREFRLEAGLLYRVKMINDKETLLYVVPTAMRKALTIRHNDLGSHLGVDKVTTTFGI